jgi:hypothetical protein
MDVKAVLWIAAALKNFVSQLEGQVQDIWIKQLAQNNLNEKDRN